MQCTCPKECDCQNPEPENDGCALVSNSCPIHNLYPDPAEDCPLHLTREPAGVHVLTDSAR